MDDGSDATKHPEGYRYPVTFTEEGTPENGTPAAKVRLVFSKYKTGIFTYDAASDLYMVSQYGGEYVDGNTGEQIGVTNLLVLETDINRIAGVKEGRLTVDLVGEGNGTYFCGGKSVPITWSKADRNSPFVYTCSGAPLALERGVSYICIMDPADSVLSIE